MKFENARVHRSKVCKSSPWTTASDFGVSSRLAVPLVPAVAEASLGGEEEEGAGTGVMERAVY